MAKTKEQVYRQQMIELGIYEEVFEPEIRTLARIERELTRAMKAWSATAPPGGKPSFLDDHYPVIQKLRAEALQHREALGLTPKALRKLTGAAGTDAPMQKDLITTKLDEIAQRVAGYDSLPIAQEAAAVSEMMDEELRANVTEYGGLGEPQRIRDVSTRVRGFDEDLAAAVAEDMG